MMGLTLRTIWAAAIAAVLFAGAALAQETERGGFFEQLFGGSERAPTGEEQAPAPDRTPNTGRFAQSSGADLMMRIDRLEAQIRQLTGAIEQLQYRNQQLEGQLRRMQPDADYRFQDGGGMAPRSTPMRPPATPQAAPPQVQPPPPAATPGRRSDVFDPTLNPNAPGAPQPLGSTSPSAPLDPGESVGAPGGRQAGAPLDLSTVSGYPGAGQAPGGMAPPGGGMAPPAGEYPPRNPGGTDTQVATLPP